MGSYPSDNLFCAVHIDIWAPDETATFELYKTILVVMNDMNSFVIGRPLTKINSLSFAMAYTRVACHSGFSRVIIIDVDSKSLGNFSATDELLQATFHRAIISK